MSVTGPPSFICFTKVGITEPDDPRTFPNRTIDIVVDMLFDSAAIWHTISARRLVAPITLVGRTALSVEIKVNELHLALIAALSNF